MHVIFEDAVSLWHCLFFVKLDIFNYFIYIYIYAYTSKENVMPPLQYVYISVNVNKKTQLLDVLICSVHNVCLLHSSAR